MKRGSVVLLVGHDLTGREEQSMRRSPMYGCLDHIYVRDTK
jgi:hypothetical protein